MKFKSQLVSQVSGSVGGITGAHNQGGLYFRSRSVPTNPQSPQQTAIRNALSSLATAWSSTLSQAERDAWETYNQNVQLTDALGEPRSVGAIGMYNRSNVSRIQAGLPRVDDGPTTFDLGSFTNVSIAAPTAGSPYTVDIDFDNTDAWANEDDAAMLVYLSREQNPGINFFKGPYRFAGKIDGNSSTAPTSPATIQAPFDGAAGNAVFGYVIVTRADGRLSPLQRFRGQLT
jgi:hypothetical protein